MSVTSVVPDITLHECLASFVFFFNHPAGFGRGRKYLTHVSRNWNNPQVTSTEVNLDKLNAVFNTEKCKDPEGQQNGYSCTCHALVCEEPEVGFSPLSM